ncbi:hypothetical protein U1Q18_025908 [Sarracenia purpurea var. burkii]
MGNGSVLLSDFNESGRAPVKVEYGDIPEGGINLVPAWIAEDLQISEDEPDPSRCVVRRSHLEDEITFICTALAGDGEKVVNVKKEDLRPSRPYCSDGRAMGIRIGRRRVSLELLQDLSDHGDGRSEKLESHPDRRVEAMEIDREMGLIYSNGCHRRNLPAGDPPSSGPDLQIYAYMKFVGVRTCILSVFL